jgi:hypothetical protein
MIGLVIFCVRQSLGKVEIAIILPLTEQQVTIYFYINQINIYKSDKDHDVLDSFMFLLLPGTEMTLHRVLLTYTFTQVHAAVISPTFYGDFMTYHRHFTAKKHRPR